MERGLLLEYCLFHILDLDFDHLTSGLMAYDPTATLVSFMMDDATRSTAMNSSDGYNGCYPSREWPCKGYTVQAQCPNALSNT